MHSHTKEVCNVIRSTHQHLNALTDHEFSAKAQKAYTAVVVVSGIKKVDHIGSETSAHVLLLNGLFLFSDKCTRVLRDIKRSPPGSTPWMVTLCQLNTSQSDQLKHHESFTLHDLTDVQLTEFDIVPLLSLKLISGIGRVTAFISDKTAESGPAKPFVLDDVSQQVCEKIVFNQNSVFGCSSYLYN